jgi:hypothetical protein
MDYNVLITMTLIELEAAWYVAYTAAEDSRIQFESDLGAANEEDWDAIQYSLDAYGCAYYDHLADMQLIELVIDTCRYKL